MASVYSEEEKSLSPYRKLLVDLSFDLSKKEIETLKLAGVDFIPRRVTENIATGLQFFDVLEQDGRIGPRKLNLLQDMLKTVGRVDLARKIQAFLTTSVKSEIDEVTSLDGGFNDAENGRLPNHAATYGNPSVNDPEGTLTCDKMAGQDDSVPDGIEKNPPLTDDVATSRQDGTHYKSHLRGMGGSKFKDQLIKKLTGNLRRLKLGRNKHKPLNGFVPVSSGTQTGQQHTGIQGSVASGRIKHFGPESTRYVDFLAYQGYVVGILGGEHFKTPEGEFVEMKSGTQYKIHVKNTHAYGCHLNISIDGYDVGGWIVDGGQEFTIERPAYEAKKFTFYRVKTAPKKAGIEPGRAENGVVKCVFTPEAFLNIPVTIPKSRQPLNINLPASASVGDLKREIQHQLNETEDPDQVLCSDDKVLLNSLSVTGLSTRNLRLIGNEFEITIETSTETNFSLKVHPGRAKVRDVIEQIERKLKVPHRDQKLYHGRARLSDAPRRDLPYGLICSLQPTLILIIPEYIHITVVNENGVLHTIKIDKEKSPKELIQEIPSCSSLQQNEEALLFFNGRQMRPTKDERTLARLGLVSGSKLELKVNIVFITVQVYFPNLLPFASVTCSPHETFKDLVKKLETGGKRTDLEKVTFAMQGRVFDPDQDKASLQEYGITHGSVLEMRRDRGKSSAASGELSLSDALMCLEKGSLSDDEDRMPPLPTMASKFKGFSVGDAVGLVDRYRHSGFNYKGSLARAIEPDPAWRAGATTLQGCMYSGFEGRANARVVERHPAWRAGGTTLKGYSTQQFMTAEPIKVDLSRRVELVLRLVARKDEKDLVFPKDECKPLSSLRPPPVPE